MDNIASFNTSADLRQIVRVLVSTEEDETVRALGEGTVLPGLTRKQMDLFSSIVATPFAVGDRVKDKVCTGEVVAVTQQGSFEPAEEQYLHVRFDDGFVDTRVAASKLAFAPTKEPDPDGGPSHAGDAQGTLVPQAKQTKPASFWPKEVRDTCTGRAWEFETGFGATAKIIEMEAHIFTEAELVELRDSAAKAQTVEELQAAITKATGVPASKTPVATVPNGLQNLADFLDGLLGGASSRVNG